VTSTTSPRETTTEFATSETHIPHPTRSIVGGLTGYFIARIGSRASYGILLTFFAQQVTGSATVAAIVATVFYISELGLAPIFGNLSDRQGRRPYLIVAPVFAAVAVAVFGLVALLPGSAITEQGWERALLILLFAVGRLFEGISAAAITPASLGFLTDVTGGDERKRVQVMTAFEIATVLGVVIGTPISNVLYSNFGALGFFGVLAIYLVSIAVLFFFVQESRTQAVAVPAKGDKHAEGLSREALRVYRNLLRNPRLIAFVPAWLAINALLAAWLGLLQFVLSLPTAASAPLRPGQRDADVRFPDQLLVGGFAQGDIGRLLASFGAMLIVGMLLWTFIMPRIGRANAMRVSLMGLFIVDIAFLLINRLADNPQSLTADDRTALYVLLPMVALGIVIASGFAPAALTQLAAISEDDPSQRGAIMGLYSLLLGGGQLLGTWIGGISIDLAGFNGLIAFAFVLIVLAVWSVQKSLAHLGENKPAALGTPTPEHT